MDLRDVAQQIYQLPSSTVMSTSNPQKGGQYSSYGVEYMA